MEPRLMTIEQLAGYLNIAPKTIANQLSLGLFPLKPLHLNCSPRWDRLRVDRWISRGCPGYEPPRSWEELPASCQHAAHQRLAIVEQARLTLADAHGHKTAELERLARARRIAPNTLRGWLAAADKAKAAAESSGADPQAAQLRALAPEYGKTRGRRTGSGSKAKPCRRQSQNRS